MHQISRDWPSDWAWYFNFKFGEYNPSASFAATQYVLVTLAAIMIALLADPRRWWHRAYWLLIALAFAFLSQDEYLTFHENVTGWELIYISGAALLMLLTALVYFAGLKRRGLWTFILLFGGLGVSGLGGAGMEFLGGLDCLGWNGPCSQLPYFEESLENLGALTALVGVLIYAWNNIPAAVWQRARRVILYGGLLSFVAFLSGPFVAPPLELRLLATPVDVDYGDIGMEIVGYYSAQTQLAPGDTLDVRLYWQRRPSNGRDFGLSLHLLSRPEAQSQGQHNKALVNPRFWQAAQGMLYHTDLSLTLDADAPAPGLYGLGVSLWSDPTQDGTIPDPEYPLQVISETDGRQISPEMAVLGNFPVIDPTASVATATALRYNFDNGLSLSGYSLDNDGDTLTLSGTTP
jgi:hypothetical protein